MRPRLRRLTQRAMLQSPASWPKRNWPRCMRGCFSLVGTFDALDARKVSIIAKGVGAILVHELRSARAMHRRERGRRPGRSLEWLKFKKLTVRKSGIQARHLYISARKRSGLRHAGKLAYPAKPLNVESLDRPIRAHKKQGNHPAGVIVDMQFPCHSTPRPGAGSMRGTRGWFQRAEPAIGSTAAPPSSGARREILESARLPDFQVATGGASAPR